MNRALNHPLILALVVLAMLLAAACEPGDFTDWDLDKWRSASVEDVRSEIDRGADIHARSWIGLGGTPLHEAATWNENPAVTEMDPEFRTGRQVRVPLLN